MTGVGGGSLMTPLLILLFGIHLTTAVGSDLLFAGSTKTVGSVVHADARTIDWMLVGLLAAGSITATVVTIILLSWFDLKSIAGQHAITLTLVGSADYRNFSDRGQKSAPTLRRTIKRARSPHFANTTVALGLVMGVLVTVTSVGAGAIGVTVLLIFHHKMPAGRVVGSDIAHAVPLTLLAGAGHWWLGSIDWHLLGTLLFGSLPGIVLGSYLATRARDAVVRVALASVLVVVGVRLIG